MASCPDIIERKVVNILAQLGSLYDASSDYLENQSVNENTRFLYYSYKHKRSWMLQSDKEIKSFRYYPI